MGKLNKCLKIYTISFKRINLCTVAMKKLEVYEILYGVEQFTPTVLRALSLSCPILFAHTHCHLQTFGKLDAL